jgi:hypothetical protein
MIHQRGRCRLIILRFPTPRWPGASRGHYWPLVGLYRGSQLHPLEVSNRLIKSGGSSRWRRDGHTCRLTRPRVCEARPQACLSVTCSLRTACRLRYDSCDHNNLYKTGNVHSGDSVGIGTGYRLEGRRIWVKSPALFPKLTWQLMNVRVFTSQPHCGQGRVCCSWQPIRYVLLFPTHIKNIHRG